MGYIMVNTVLRTLGYLFGSMGVFGIITDLRHGEFSSTTVGAAVMLFGIGFLMIYFGTPEKERGVNIFKGISKGHIALIVCVIGVSFVDTESENISQNSSIIAEQASTPEPELTEEVTLEPELTEEVTLESEPTEEVTLEPEPTEEVIPEPEPTEEVTPEPESTAAVAPEPIPTPEPELMTPTNTRVYVGSTDSDKYHYETCRWAEKILAANLLTFDSADSAKARGYVACGTCKPS